MRIIYIVPDSTRPSWGLGVIYHHVEVLNKAGKNAYIMHQKKGFKLGWLPVKVPILYFENSKLEQSDILIVPEVMTNIKGLQKMKCRKILLVQATAFLFESLPDDETHISLGFKDAIGIMPHMIPIIENFIHLRTKIIPPFIADYFYKGSEKLHDRKKKILIYPKFQQQDYIVIRRLIQDKLKAINPTGLTSLFNKGWQLVEVKDKTHQEVAELMQESTFFISTNSFEAFNTSVPEAMAAGCINLCYEGFGPRDYLKDKENAFVFQNNEAYSLCNFLFQLIDKFEENVSVFSEMRERAHETARRYTLANAKPQIITYFENLPLD